MKQWITALVLLGSANAASATVIDFDDLTGAGLLPANYQGFTWTGWRYYDTVQTPFTPASGATRIYADPAENSISSATDFVFNGSYLSGFADSVTVQYLLYNNNSLVFSSAEFNSLSATPTYFASGYNGLVDKVVYLSVANQPTNGSFSVDNLTYSATAVPEPESMSLLLAGLGLTGWMRRRAQKKAAKIA